MFKFGGYPRMRSAIVRNKYVVFKDHKTPSNYPELMTLSVTRSYEIETQSSVLLSISTIR